MINKKIYRARHSNWTRSWHCI